MSEERDPSCLWNLAVCRILMCTMEKSIKVNKFNYHTPMPAPWRIVMYSMFSLFNSLIWISLHKNGQFFQGLHVKIPILRGSHPWITDFPPQNGFYVSYINHYLTLFCSWYKPLCIIYLQNVLYTPTQTTGNHICITACGQKFLAYMIFTLSGDSMVPIDHRH